MYVERLGGSEQKPHISLLIFSSSQTLRLHPLHGKDTPSSFVQEVLELNKNLGGLYCSRRKIGEDIWFTFSPSWCSLPASRPASWLWGSFADLSLRSCLSEVPQTFHAAVASGGSLWVQVSLSFVPSYQGSELQEHGPPQSPASRAWNRWAWLLP